MTQPKPTVADERIIETMIELGQCSKLDRILVASSNGPHQMFALHRRGYDRVATTATCGLPRGQYAVALVDWHQSIKALETTLDWLVHFLATTGVLVIRVDSSERTGNRKLRSALERLGFQIEVGTRCEDGLAFSARRREVAQTDVAA